MKSKHQTIAIEKWISTEQEIPSTFSGFFMIFVSPKLGQFEMHEYQCVKPHKLSRTITNSYTHRQIQMHTMYVYCCIHRRFNLAIINGYSKQTTRFV